MRACIVHHGLWLIFLLFAVAPGASAWELKRQALTSGGLQGASYSFRLKGTAAEAVPGGGEASGFSLNSGFWYNNGVYQACVCGVGDVNENGQINILDIVFLVDFKFKNGPAPTPYEICNGDTDCNCLVNILDIIVLINYKFKAGPPPCECREWTGACGEY